MSPVTGKGLASKQLVPNQVMKQLIQRHPRDLPPCALPVPHLARLGIGQLEIVLSFLDGTALGRMQVASTHCMAVGSKPALWNQLLAAEHLYGSVDNPSEDPRACYARLRRSQQGDRKSEDDKRASRSL